MGTGRQTFHFDVCQHSPYNQIFLGRQGRGINKKGQIYTPGLPSLAWAGLVLQSQQAQTLSPSPSLTPVPLGLLSTVGMVVLSQTPAFLGSPGSSRVPPEVADFEGHLQMPRSFSHKTHSGLLSPPFHRREQGHRKITKFVHGHTAALCKNIKTQKNKIILSS